MQLGVENHWYKLVKKDPEITAPCNEGPENIIFNRIRKHDKKCFKLDLIVLNRWSFLNQPQKYL